MIEIPVTQGFVALVDEVDAALVKRYQWQIRRDSSGILYARTRLNRRPGHRDTMLMHRMALGDPIGQIDHINGNGLDNRRANLRLATPRQNQGNSRSHRGSSRFKGVSWSPSKSRWCAYIKVGGRQLSLGTFHDEASAALSYDAAARDAFGSYAALNFPRADEQPAVRAELVMSHA